MDPALLALIERLNDPTQSLTLEELRELETGLIAHAGTVDPAAATSEDIELLTELADQTSDVRGRIATLETEATERQERAAELLATLNPEPAATDGPGDPVRDPAASPDETTEAGDPHRDPGAGSPQAPAETPDPNAEPGVVPEQAQGEPVPVAAAGAPTPGAPQPQRLPRIARLAARRPERAAPAPALTATAANGERQRPVLLASADLPGVAAGAEIDVEQWAHGAMRRFEAVRMVRDTGSDGEKVYFGTIRAFYPESRQLGDDAAANEEKFDAVSGPKALAASGGICGPVAVDYAVSTIAQASRTVATEAMTTYQATRGGVRYILPHTLAAVTADAPAAIWTEANDISLNSPATKPHATFVCQSPQEAYVNAITSIVQFGNFQSRYFPEQIAQYLDTVDAVHARLAEATLLADLATGSTAVTADNYELGAARDMLAILDRATAAMRYRHRMIPHAPLRFVMPLWTRDMLRADQARQLPGDSYSGAERLAVADALIDSWFAARNVNVTTTQDSPTGASVLQGFLAQGAGQLVTWPLKTITWLYPEGTWSFLDGGELNLGMVRDSTLNRTNDFQMFSETFENAIFRGHESQQLTFSIAPTGASAGTVSTESFTAGTGIETLGS